MRDCRQNQDGSSSATFLCTVVLFLVILLLQMKTCLLVAECDTHTQRDCTHTHTHKKKKMLMNALPMLLLFCVGAAEMAASGSVRLPNPKVQSKLSPLHLQLDAFNARTMNRIPTPH